MRRLLLLSWLLVAADALAQTPAPPRPAAPTTPPATAKPSTPAPAPGAQKPAPPATAPAPPRRPAAQTSTRAGITITVTDMRGMTISGVHVDVAGPTERMGETNTSGQVNFPGLTAGTYRLRFSGEPVTTFEKE